MHVPERVGLVAQLRQLPAIESALAAFSQVLLPPLVDGGVADVEDDRGDYSQTHKTQFKPVPENIAGGIWLAVEIRSHCSPEISHPDLDCHTCAALIAPGEVVGQPCDVTREAWIDSTHDDEDSAVHHTRVLCWICGNAPGNRVSLWMALDNLDGADGIYMANPMIITQRKGMMNGLLLPARSER